ncbi:uncharacterized protein [Montipora capricornis]|uniref:uncharacterized protein isoform X1 n=1 Tax=Montipora capricornis TaxID=246305 RepID=UPI0035F10912
MEFLIFFSLFICIALGSSDLSELAVCEGEGVAKDSHCRDGLVCRMTKSFTVRGQTFPVKQCMEPDRDVDVETVNMDEEKDSFKARSRRFIPGILQSCQSEGDCQANFCCVNIIKKCMPKLLEMAECNTQIFHGCGCQDGLECQQTGTITVPIIGIQLPLMQCVSSIAPPPGGM